VTKHDVGGWFLAPIQAVLITEALTADEDESPPTMAPSQQRAAVVTETGVDLRLVDIPPLGPRQIRIKVTAVAQNPIDCQFITTFRMHQQATHRPF
jgi:hypothetical protein